MAFEPALAYAAFCLKLETFQRAIENSSVGSLTKHGFSALLTIRCTIRRPRIRQEALIVRTSSFTGGTGKTAPTHRVAGQSRCIETACQRRPVFLQHPSQKR
jgi:hypothetical protein